MSTTKKSTPNPSYYHKQRPEYQNTILESFYDEDMDKTDLLVGSREDCKTDLVAGGSRED